MDIAGLQLKIMTSGDSFYSQNRLSYCIEVTKRDQKLKEATVITHLLKLYDKMAASNEEKTQIYLYLLKHEKRPAKEVRKGLRKIGLEKRKVDIGGLGTYEYAIFDLEKGKYDKLSPVEQLERAGVTTLEIIPPRELKKYQREFDATLEGFPEYKRYPDNPTLDREGNPLVYVAGGFAALGNPASFHNVFSRNLRMMGYKKMKTLMNEYVTRLAHVKEPYNLQALSDRMMYRQKGQQPSAETWHRDVMPPGKIEYEDEIFGGWINLDSQDQYFSCIPGSHSNKVQKTLDAGFATLTDAVNKIYTRGGGEPKIEKRKKLTAGELKPYISEVTKDRHRFRVPPGHMIVFPQYILHEVVANKAQYDMRRQFTGFRLTQSGKPLYPLEMFDEQAVIPLPGGMIPPMYARNHLSYFQEKQFNMTPETKYNLIEWSEATFRKRCLVKTKTGKPIVQRHMESLTDYRFPLYPPYLKKERNIYLGEKVS
uniref:Uncharacterized protein n=1 Tax=Marseillevirus LCMAC101 TaxID=2506602 RepID=A0A481YSB5_9VIRU|nr:MAG: hypothetical protein LCMAC101_04450 [Marseillevirus LCMAC101]